MVNHSVETLWRNLWGIHQLTQHVKAASLTTHKRSKSSRAICGQELKECRNNYWTSRERPRGRAQHLRILLHNTG
eukprot:1160938-Pelagomonas_calceolata.AAC.20